jgi:hypothetical protein
MKVISSFIHGLIDYIVVIFLWTAPFMFEMSDLVSNALFILGGVHLLLTILTDYDLGIIKLIPLAAHGLIELIVAILLVASPWLLQVSDQPTDRNFLVIFAVAVLLIWLLSDYQQKRDVP